MGEPERARSAEERHVVGMVRWLLYLVFVVIGYLVLRVLGPVLTPVLAALAIAYLLDGAVERISARGLNRALAVAGLLVLFAALAVALLVVVAPFVSRELTGFAAQLPGLVERAAALLSSDYGIEVPSDWQAFLKGEDFRSFLENATIPVSRVATAALGGALGFLGWLAELLLVPVFAFYFLVDWSQILLRIRSLVPPRHRERVTEVAREIDRAVSGWIRGQLMVMAVLAALYAVAFKILGLHLGITVGILVGLLSIIPFLGAILGAALAVGVALLDWQGPGQLIALGSVFLLLQVVEAAVLTPRLVGKRVGLGEVGALFAVMAGGQLLGFAGVLLAIPIAASVAVLVRRALTYYETTTFFTEGAELTGAPVAVARRAAPPSRPILDPLRSAESEPESEPDADPDSDPDSDPSKEKP